MTLDEFLARHQRQVRRAKPKLHIHAIDTDEVFRPATLGRASARLEVLLFNTTLHFGIHRYSGKLLPGLVVHRLGVYSGGRI